MQVLAGDRLDVPPVVLMTNAESVRTFRDSPDFAPVVLEARNIEFSYGRVQVLFDISIQVRDGEALALLGTNGAGKSTLLRVMSGLERPSSGEVSFRGRDITGAPAEHLAGEGLVLVPGGRAVFSDMSVDENLEMQALGIRSNRQLVRERRERVFSTFPRL